MIDGFTYSDDAISNGHILEILRMLSPSRAAGVEKVRIGRNHGDGGYVMLNDFSNITAAYSLGIKDDVTWDLDVAGKGIPIYQYDHTIDALPCEHHMFHWSKIGIGDSDPNIPLVPLHELMTRNGHGADCGDLLLKCDIEGHEWRMLATMPSNMLGKFRQIVIECHGFSHVNQPDYAAIVAEGVRAMTLRHKVVHVHANNNSAYAIVGGVPVPTTLEFTLARIDAYDLSPSDEVFPTALDRPCSPHRVDYSLGRFVF